MYGVGPIYVGVIIAVTAAAVITGHYGLYEKGIISALKIPFTAVGILIIVLGICLWLGAVFRSKIDSGITENRLVTSGVYALCRNPIYTSRPFLGHLCYFYSSTKHNKNSTRNSQKALDKLFFLVYNITMSAE